MSSAHLKSVVKGGSGVSNLGKVALIRQSGAVSNNSEHSSKSRHLTRGSAIDAVLWTRTSFEINHIPCRIARAELIHAFISFLFFPHLQNTSVNPKMDFIITNLSLTSLKLISFPLT